jgi:2-O-methyltransferase
MIRNLAKRLLKRIGLQRIPRGPQPRITLDLIASVIPSAPVIIEAGAHDGFDTILMSRRFPGSTIHAFEPVPQIYARLVDRTRHLSNVRQYPMAIGEVSGRNTMFVSGGQQDTSSSLLRPKVMEFTHPGITFEKQIEVNTVSFDDWAQTCGVERVDFFWLDLQGLELAALKGATRLLGTTTAVCTEVNLLEMYAGVPLYNEVWQWMVDAGFVVHTIDVFYADQGDVLFVRKRL